MLKSKRLRLCGLFILALLASLLIAGQVRASPLADAIDWWVFGGGGGSASGGNITISDTIGQPVAGPSSGGVITLDAGFWGGVSPDYKVNLPLIRH